jgi:hypothetical protein
MIIKVNGRDTFVQHVTAVRKMRAGLYAIDAGQRGIWRLRSGALAGGAASDWQLDQGADDPCKPMICRSVREAINLIETL